MGPTLNKTLEKGIDAHKTGQVQKAHRLYAAVLKIQLKNPDANHNMSVLAWVAGKVE